MNKILPVSLLLILNIACYQNSFAHGGGSSYKFDKEDNSVDHEAVKKADEEKEAQDDWGTFMNSIDKQTKKAENSSEPNATDK